MNEEVLNMVRTLHARLDDVEAAVRALPTDEPQFAQQLDKVDDKVYLIQCEIQKLVPEAAPAAPAPAEQQSDQPADTEEGEAGANASANAEEGEPSASAATAAQKKESDSTAAASEGSEQPVDDVEPVGAAGEAATEDDDKPLISDEMKDNLKDAGRALGGILKESKDVVSELSGTVNDLKSVFKFK